ncbi:MAG: hypothetical protein N0E37_14435 [Candidatus Thiodiazotropha taylori]|nr:hypothetical protein [Candidatus Thiodiazotropha taylori]MCG7895032.1 hypothetical protein [Candidatus Thiodiazotropha taylori]MCG7908961.1 hypothetical protein [Candidatus Thiodiazotropha taylori]MCG7918943.1 hypothetical protein [Candidatus Thiodiazotropha taylori]MCG7927252.1 hypothetical protein [Candidatus Thiodiazotropha taylori]
MKLLDDKFLLLLIILLGLTLAAFLYGIFPYPFGLLVLSIMIFARFLTLRG